VLGASRDLLLTGLIVTTALGFIWAPIAGALSDRIGRRQMYIIGCIFVAIFTFAYFAMLGTRNPWVIFTAVALSFIPVMTMYGPEAALIDRGFHTATALQRRLDWLSASLDHRRRVCALHLNLAIRDPSLDGSDRHLCHLLCDHQHHRNGTAAGLYQQGHLYRGALRRAAVTACVPVSAAGAAASGSDGRQPGILAVRSGVDG
jgi:hypothetical protein